jgi:hypothetical protein|nr:hypothetical protein [Aeromicrobium sp.]
MNTTVTTRNPVRDDVAPGSSTSSAPAETSRRWALAGVVGALSSIAAGAVAVMIDAVYDESLVGDPEGIVASLSEKTGLMTAFHVLSVVGALLLVVFGLGLHRRLRESLPAGSLVPGIAAAGVLGTVVVLVMGSSLDTEFIFGVAEDDLVNPANAALYNHWIGTIPAVWVLIGLSGLAMFAAARQGAVARWLGLVGLVLGGLTLLVGIAPVQYMAGLTGALWLLITAVGLLAGDRTRR